MKRSRIGAASAIVAALSLCPGSPTPGELFPRAVHASATIAQEPAGPLWFVPTRKERDRAEIEHAPLATASRKYAEGEFFAALAAARKATVADGPLRDYAVLYRGLSELRTNQVDAARRTLDALRERRPPGYVAIAAALASGEAAEVAGDHAAAVAIYERLISDQSAIDEDVLSRLGRAALAAGDRRKAADAYRRVYYEFALTDAAAQAADRLATLADRPAAGGYKADFNRASMLFGARRYDEARAAYESVLPHTSGDDREVAELRIAESNFFLRRYDAAIAGLAPHLDRASRKAEARFFHLSALREKGQHETYLAQTRALVDEFPDSSWAEEALNNLGTYHILNNDDEAAARAFAELYQKFPAGPRAERAAWKAGWWSYKNGDYANTIRVFESAAGSFPRSDYRPSFLYWSARSHGKLDHGTEAVERLQVVHADYANSYYGRLATERLARRGVPLPLADRPVSASRQPIVSAGVRPLTEGRIRALLAAGLYDDGLKELRYAQRTFGGGPALDASIAWAYQQKGELRRAITLMRRAYPQFLTAGGQQLPAEILQVIFPLTYWESIRRHAAARDLDPYLVAALIAQESTFDPKIRSVANAWGLMQIVPATGRRLARNLGIRGFSTSMLTDPETNIRMGTLYFSQLVRQFGGIHYALASYNAGESRVVRWKAERPGLDADEFIDDIPFPETQNYVKRILGTAEDYRRLYGEGGGRPIPVAVSSASPRSRTAAGPGGRAPAGAVRKPARKAPRKPVKRPTSRSGARQG